MNLPPFQRGFTLLEILAVLALLGIALAVTAFSLDGGLDRARLDASARDIVAALRHTRTRALVEHRPQWFTLDLNARTFASPGRDPQGIPGGTVLHVTSAAEDVQHPGEARIRFFPDGSSTGGNIELTRKNREVRIDVDWLTGAVAEKGSGSFSGGTAH
ncbi:MAG TPA: GspH/FimT family pseudopilin [Rhodanobacteraceae bacterium]|nr:GspH/FimT family pseudopilin [Rhodanobacteraceae bacterium]